MVSGFWLTQNIIAIYVPTGLLTNTLHLSSFQLTSTLLLSYVVLCFSYIGAGMFRQKIGRRRFFVTVGPLIAIIGAALLYAHWQCARSLAARNHADGLRALRTRDVALGRADHLYQRASSSVS
jgi:hypothetical protein